MKLRDLLEVLHPDMEIVVIQGDYEVKNTVDEALAFYRPDALDANVIEADAKDGRLAIYTTIDSNDNAEE